jgi:hypothetical protein
VAGGYALRRQFFSLREWWDTGLKSMLILFALASLRSRECVGICKLVKLAGMLELELEVREGG